MALLATLLLREAFNRWSWLGAGLGFAGVAIIASGQPGGLSFGNGASLIVLAALCAAAYSVLQRPLLGRAASLDVTAMVLVAGALSLLPWLADGIGQLRAAEPATIAVVVFLAVGPGIAGQACWTYAIRSFGAARAGQFLYLIPPCAVLLAWALLGETPRTSTLLGGALALIGVVLVNSKGRAKSA